MHMIFVLLENLLSSSFGWGYGICTGNDTFLRRRCDTIKLFSGVAFCDFSFLSLVRLNNYFICCGQSMSMIYRQQANTLDIYRQQANTLD